MKKRVSVVYLGPGKVGSEVLRILDKLNLPIEIVGIARSETKSSEIEGWIKTVGSKLIVVDTTASDDTLPYLMMTLEQGGYIVSSNKKPYSRTQREYQAVVQYREHVFYETTVGAGLPVISTIRELLSSGDKIVRIRGCFSGTLGFVFSQLEQGVDYGKVVAEAKEMGYTEPDPRDDLSGLDVARKALILQRLIGESGELDQIKIEKLYPGELAKVEVAEFMQRITEYDAKMQERMDLAKQKKTTLRYVADVTPEGCQVGVCEVEQTSDLGSLQGPDNILIIQTERYHDRPLVIKGPGAGVPVTAGGVVGDIIKILERI
ncbi:MAG: homoserine dehydrogenase [bacterium]